MLMFFRTRWSDIGWVSEVDPGANMRSSHGSDLVMRTALPTGTVTLLLADIESSTRLWRSQPNEMTAAIAQLDRVVSEAIVDHDDGVARLDVRFGALDAQTV